MNGQPLSRSCPFQNTGAVNGNLLDVCNRLRSAQYGSWLASLIGLLSQSVLAMFLVAQFTYPDSTRSSLRSIRNPNPN